MRHLVDRHGRDWRVYERSNSANSSLPDRRSLVFDTEGMVRRVWRYPLAWASLSDEALLRLMDADDLGDSDVPPA
jgi:hypothetical protein